jgi:protoporphyrinogen oxidase
MPEQEIINLASEELRQTGIVKDAPILDGFVYYIPRCYPVYEKGYKAHLDVVKSWLDQFGGLQPIGRYGAFNYTNQDHSILMGLLAAENIFNQKQHNLWEINSEEQYQEDSVIDEQGIVTE